MINIIGLSENLSEKLLTFYGFIKQLLDGRLCRPDSEQWP